MAASKNACFQWCKFYTNAVKENVKPENLENDEMLFFIAFG